MARSASEPTAIVPLRPEEVVGAGRRRRRELGDPRQRQAALVVSLRQQHRVQQRSAAETWLGGPQVIALFDSMQQA